MKVSTNNKSECFYNDVIDCEINFCFHGLCWMLSEAESWESVVCFKN